MVKIPMKVLHSWNCPFLRTWPFRGFPEDKLINPIFKSPLPGICDEFLRVSRLGLPRVASFTYRNIREHLSVLTNLYKPPRPLWANARFSRLPIQFYDPVPFLASQDALEVMLVSEWVSQWVSHSKKQVDWCDPGEWRYLLKTLLMRLWRLMIHMKMMLERLWCWSWRLTRWPIRWPTWRLTSRLIWWWI